MLSLPSIAAALANPQWALPKVYPPHVLEQMLSNSLCLGLYKKSASPDFSSLPQQIGLARLVTDHVTFAIIADVYVLPEEQGKGFGRWLLQCVNEILKDMDTTLRRVTLVCREGSLEASYEEELGMKRWGTKAVGGLLMMHREGQGSGLGEVQER
ncbi:MAG: hypothetical protein Q9201_002282 [Fulgogasparrea decipioides]